MSQILKHPYIFLEPHPLWVLQYGCQSIAFCIVGPTMNSKRVWIIGVGARRKGAAGHGLVRGMVAHDGDLAPDIEDAEDSAGAGKDKDEE